MARDADSEASPRTSKRAQACPSALLPYLCLRLCMYLYGPGSTRRAEAPPVLPSLLILSESILPPPGPARKQGQAQRSPLQLRATRQVSGGARAGAQAWIPGHCHLPLLSDILINILATHCYLHCQATSGTLFEIPQTLTQDVFLSPSQNLRGTA